MLSVGHLRQSHQVHVRRRGAEYLLHAAGRHESVPSSNRWDPDDPLVGLYPNGCPGADCAPLASGIETAIEIETDVTSTFPTNAAYDEFVALAEAAAASGRYLGFGEIGALHYSQREGHPYIHFPANHAWMKTLVDIAAAAPSPMVIDLHLEIDATSQAELEDLLAHDRSVNIVLEHAGWSTYGGATAATLSSLMAANSNLYLALKKCQHGDIDSLDACYLDRDHSVKAPWVTLLTTYASRIMIGTDAKYWQDGGATAVSTTMSDGLRPDLQALLNTFIGTATRMAIQDGTARRLFRLP